MPINLLLLLQRAFQLNLHPLQVRGVGLPLLVCAHGFGFGLLSQFRRFHRLARVVRLTLIAVLEFRQRDFDLLAVNRDGVGRFVLLFGLLRLCWRFLCRRGRFRTFGLLFGLFPFGVEHFSKQACRLIGVQRALAGFRRRIVQFDFL